MENSVLPQEPANNKDLSYDYVRHLRVGHDRTVSPFGGATIIAKYLQLDINLFYLHYGVAFCSIKDRYNKHRGIERAKYNMQYEYHAMRAAKAPTHALTRDVLDLILFTDKRIERWIKGFQDNPTLKGMFLRSVYEIQHNIYPEINHFWLANACRFVETIRMAPGTKVSDPASLAHLPEVIVTEN